MARLASCRRKISLACVSADSTAIIRSVITLQELENLLPFACAWAEEQERLILREGVSLTDALVADARRVGLEHPERVRVMSVATMPTPQDPVIREAARAAGLTPDTAGLSLRYGIFIRSEHWGKRKLVVHELVHTAQYERLGSVRLFLQQYLYECITFGYPAAPMEQEAIMVSHEACSSGE